MKWEIFNLGEVSKSIQTGPFGSQLHQSDYSEEGYPVIMPKDLIEGHISEASIARVSKKHVERLCKHKTELGDIIYSRRGDVGRCAFVTDKETGWLCGTGCIRVTIDKSKAVSKYVFYYLQTSESIGWVENHAVGSTMLNLNTSILSGVPLKLPPKNVQNKIVDVLSAYDCQIENNQKQIKLLEEAAQRLYKEWFIDLRFPGHETTPIVNGIPEGWRKGMISEIVEYYDKIRKPLSSIERKAFQGKYKYYGAAGVLDHVKEFLYDGTFLLMGEDGTVINPNGTPVLQYVSGKFWVNNHAHVLKGKKPYSTEFVYMMFNQLQVTDIVTGVAQPKISQARLNQKGIIIPSIGLVLEYSKKTDSIFKSIILLTERIEILQQARDRLLPKLMSGEIEV